METIKVGIGRVIFNERELCTITESDRSAIKNSKIEKEKEWITESIILAIKKHGFIKFEVEGNFLLGSINISEVMKTEGKTPCPLDNEMDVIKLKPNFGIDLHNVIKSFTSVYEKLPDQKQEVQVVFGNNFSYIGKCMYFADIESFCTYYKMSINGITHWRNVNYDDKELILELIINGANITQL